MAPFAHSLFTTMFGIGVWFALQQRSALAKVGCILLGYARGGDHARDCGTARRCWASRPTSASTCSGWCRSSCWRSCSAVSSRRREQRVVTEKLPGMVAAGLVTPNEATWLGSIQNRKLAISEATRFGGKPAAQGGQDLRRPGRGAGVRARPHRSRFRRPAGVRDCRPRRPTRYTPPGRPRRRCRAWPGFARSAGQVNGLPSRRYCWHAGAASDRRHARVPDRVRDSRPRCPDRRQRCSLHRSIRDGRRRGAGSRRRQRDRDSQRGPWPVARGCRCC